MKKMTGHEIRQAFLDFFADRDHRLVRSHALTPPNDPTLYFINAGMVQFKDIFVGARSVDYQRAVSCQKCLRVSGKHNDLENVGRTARHHTFFEMLGNFSFGDYFKRDAIRFAWDFLTEVIELPVDKLHVTVYPEDDEAYAIWKDEVGVDPARLHRDPENFWQMADVGPCGPCSEIHFDLGPERSGGVDHPFGHPEADARYLEIWNLVFMQFNRDEQGVDHPLPSPSIDTGSGLERVAQVLQGVETNYDTDLFMPLIEAMAERAGVTYRAEGGEETDVALRVIADHSRAAAFLIADGIYPDNEGRGYVLRRIMRRAIRFGRILGVEEPFLVHTTAKVIETMGEHYPELVQGKDTIHRIVLKEEKTFGRTIKAGLKRLNDALASATDAVLDGRVAFELYDTHGFPPDLTALIAEDAGVRVDQAGFDAAMEEQKARGRAASKFGLSNTEAYQALVEAGITSAFVGYDELEASSAVEALLVGGERVPRVAAGQSLEIVVGTTPFYAESGGQVGDVGVMTTDGGAVIRIENTLKPFGDLIVHFGVVEQGELSEGDAVSLSVDGARRTATRKNHSATHLMHHALREILGEHVRQRGSLVSPDRLRFDFSHTDGLSAEEITAIERRVNGMILSNEPVNTEVLPMDDALAAGAIAFFEEKYGDEVRMLRVGHESIELCGGTHVNATGDIGFFKIVSEGGISSGVRRVEALTGMGALDYVQRQEALLSAAAGSLRVPGERLPGRIEKLIEERKELAKELADAQLKVRLAEASDAISEAREVGGFKAFAVHLDGVGGRDMRAVAERLRDKLGAPGAIMLVGTSEGKVSLVVAATKDAAKRLHAGQAVRALTPLVGGKGGGRPDFAQGGGDNAEGVTPALEKFYAMATEAFA